MVLSSYWPGIVYLLAKYCTVEFVKNTQLRLLTNLLAFMMLFKVSAVFLPPLPKVGCPKNFEIWNPWRKVNSYFPLCERGKPDMVRCCAPPFPLKIASFSSAVQYVITVVICGSHYNMSTPAGPVITGIGQQGLVEIRASIAALIVGC